MKLVSYVAVWFDPPPRRAWGFERFVLRAPVTDLFDFFFEKEKKVSPGGKFVFGFFPRQHLVEIWARRQKFMILWRSLACKMTRSDAPQIFSEHQKVFIGDGEVFRNGHTTHTTL